VAEEASDEATADLLTQRI